MSNRSRRAIVAVLLAVAASRCGLIVGPICRARQHQAPVATLSGDVAAGTIVVHRVKYGTAGSQNDLRLTWTGQHEPDGPRLRVYLTRVECQALDPLGDRGPRGDACAHIGSVGSTISPDARSCVRSGNCTPQSSDLVQVTAGLSHGRGNPETLGPAAEYKVWIVGDARRPATYRIDITSFYGPDC